jgi:hypothetical protein
MTTRFDKLPKYHKDRPFEDPILRCDSCKALVTEGALAKFGVCSCGNRRFKNVQALSEREMKTVKEWGVDPDFLALFEGVDTTGLQMEGLE